MINVIYNRTIQKLVLILFMVLGLVVIVVNIVGPDRVTLALGGFLRQLSPSDGKILFNCIYYGLAFILSGFVLYFYPQFHHDLFWGVVLILFASLLFGLYGESFEAFRVTKDALKPEEEAVRISLSENLRILAFVVPAVMLGVAVNLITQFLNASRYSYKAMVLLKRSRREDRYKIR